MNMLPALAKPPVCWGGWLVEIRWGDTGSTPSSATSCLCDPGHIPGPLFPHLSNRLLGRPVGMPRPTLMEGFDSFLRVFIKCFQGSSLPGTVSSPSAPHTDRPHCMALCLGFFAVPSPPPGPLSFQDLLESVCGVSGGASTLRNEGSRASWRYPGRLTS